MKDFYDDMLEEKRSQMLEEQEKRNKMLNDAKASATQLYYDTTGNVDFGIPSDDIAKPQLIDISNSPHITSHEEKVDYGIPLSINNQENYRPNLRNSDSQIDYGIPNDETSRMINQTNYRSDIRNSDSQFDFGIPTQDIANIERTSIEEWQNERNNKFVRMRNKIIATTPTQYIDTLETKETNFNYIVSGDENWALSKLYSLLHMPDTLEYTEYVIGYLDNLKEKPEYYNKILLTILYDFVSIKKKVIKGKYLQKYERQQLLNSIKFFAIFVEKGYPIDYHLFNEFEVPYKLNYGDYFYTERIPYDIVIQQMIEVIEEKNDIIGDEVTNPINIIFSTTGNEKIKATTLGKLALKAHYTDHKLSDDVLNFPYIITRSTSLTQESQEVRKK